MSNPWVENRDLWWRAAKHGDYWTAQYRIDSDMEWSEFPRRFASKHDAELVGWAAAILESESPVREGVAA